MEQILNYFIKLVQLAEQVFSEWKHTFSHIFLKYHTFKNERSVFMLNYENFFKSN